MNNKKLSPVKSLFVTIRNYIRGEIHFPDNFNGHKVKTNENHIFEIFRHIIIGSKEDIPRDAAIFIVRFQLTNMSISKNKYFSKFPIPFFIGLPGFKAKFWMCNEEIGFNQGIYQWETVEDAENYSKSFAVKFMTNRSDPSTVSYEILPNINIYEYLKEFTK